MKNLLLAILLFVSVAAIADEMPGIRDEDKVRIAEAYRISEMYGDNIWEGWSEAPYAIMLVADDYEYLIGLTPLTDDFVPLGYDTVLQSDVYYRDRTFDKGLLATFPAIAGVPTIVIGLPENTGLNSIGWTITLLHEHFHQLQMSKPDYFSSVNELELAGDDQTGMWMINYNFPYDDEEIGSRIKKMNGLLGELIAKYDDTKYSEYMSIRNELKETLKDKDYKYLSFQLWQEGLARYTEMKVMEYLNEGYTPTEEFQNLSDYQPMDQAIIYAFKELQKTLKEAELKDYQRVLFYSIGAGEGLLLDKVNLEWKRKYFTEKFYIENYY